MPPEPRPEQLRCWPSRRACYARRSSNPARSQAPVARSDTPRGPGPAQDPAHQQQPGREDGAGVRTLHVVEERGVHRPGAVVQGQEDDPAAGPDRRGLGGHLHSGDQQLAPAAAAQQLGGERDAQGAQQRQVVADDVLARVEAEDARARCGPVRSTLELGQSGGHQFAIPSRPPVRPMSRGSWISGACRLLAAWPPGPRAWSRGSVPPPSCASGPAIDPLAATRRSTRSARPRSATASSRSRVVSRPRVDRVERSGLMPYSASKAPASTSRSVTGCGDPGPAPEVGQRLVRLPGDDAVDLGLVDAADVGQRRPGCRSRSPRARRSELHHVLGT